MQDICNINRGKVISKNYITEHPGEYPVYSSQTENNGEMGKIDTYDYDGEYVSWTTDGVYAGTVFYRNGKFNITNICGLLQLKSTNVKYKFLYYMLSTLTYKYVNPAMGNAKLMSNVMANIEIPIPPLDVQEYIINILDKFDTLVNDIFNGIPAEIELTKKLYKGYLKQLLTFQAKE